MDEWHESSRIVKTIWWCLFLFLFPFYTIWINFFVYCYLFISILLTFGHSFSLSVFFSFEFVVSRNCSITLFSVACALSCTIHFFFSSFLSMSMNVNDLYCGPELLASFLKIAQWNHQALFWVFFYLLSSYFELNKKKIVPLCGWPVRNRVQFQLNDEFIRNLFFSSSVSWLKYFARQITNNCVWQSLIYSNQSNRIKWLVWYMIVSKPVSIRTIDTNNEITKDQMIISRIST